MSRSSFTSFNDLEFRTMLALGSAHRAEISYENFFGSIEIESPRFFDDNYEQVEFDNSDAIEFITVRVRAYAARHTASWLDGGSGTVTLDFGSPPSFEDRSYRNVTIRENRYNSGRLADI